MPHPPSARRSARPDRAVTVTRTRKICFSDTLQVTGVLGPRSEVLVRPDREGLQITQVQVEPGDTVVAGQILARLAPPDGQGTGREFRCARRPPEPSCRPPPWWARWRPGAGSRCSASPCRARWNCWPKRRSGRSASLAPNQAAAVEIVGVGSLPGRVRLISGTINQATQLGQVRVFIGSDARLRAGAFGRARIDVAQRCGTAVPLSAVLYGSGGPVVQVVRDGRVESRRVTVGLMAAGQAEIREGLSEGDMVVARAGAFLREGDRVRPVVATDAPE